MIELELKNLLFLSINTDSAEKIIYLVSAEMNDKYRLIKLIGFQSAHDELMKVNSKNAVKIRKNKFKVEKIRRENIDLNFELFIYKILKFIVNII